MKTDFINNKLQLRCPVCSEKLNSDVSQKSLLCENSQKSHTFDFAKSGYINLNQASATSGDSKEMVQARSAFLEKDYYKGISCELNSIVSKYKNDIIVDAGCGEGYYTYNLAKSVTNANILGVDLSKPTCEHAAKYAKRTSQEIAERLLYVVGSVYELPVKDESVDVVVNLFAPFAEEEFSRVLKKGGIAICVASGKNHLMKLKEAVYDNPRQNEERQDLAKNMELIQKSNVSYLVDITSKTDIQSLFKMTPYYYKTSLKDAEKLSVFDTLTINVDVDFYVYIK